MAWSINSVQSHGDHRPISRFLSQSIPLEPLESSDGDEQNRYIRNWLRGTTSINKTPSSKVSCSSCLVFLIMAKLTETGSTKSSVVSSKAASIKKSIRKGANAITRPFKKLKKSISSSIRSRSPMVDVDADADKDDEDIVDVGSSDSGSDGEPQLTPEQELGT